MCDECTAVPMPWEEANNMLIRHSLQKHDVMVWRHVMRNKTIKLCQKEIIQKISKSCGIIGIIKRNTNVILI